MRHPQLFIFLAGTLEPPYRLGIATTKELKVAEARLDLGDGNVHAARAGTFQGALVKLLGTLKLVQLGIRVRESVLGHRLPNLFTKLPKPAIRRGAILLRQTILIA